MWNGIKTAAAAFVFAALIFLFPCARAEIIGSATGTDIVAYINNYPVPSYNINGSTAVITSDLANYGFTYTYSDALRRVDLIFNGAPPAPVLFWRDQRTYGKPVANVWSTDIKVFLNGAEIPSFNVDGLTAIYFSQLRTLGPLIYDDQKRAAFMTIPLMASTVYAPVEERAEAKTTLNYVWSSDGRDWSLSLTMPVAEYDRCHDIPRRETGVNNYAAYASDSECRSYTKIVADGISKTAEENALSEREKLNMAIAFVQSINYVSDISAKGVDEYVSYPSETLFENQGDCEDTSILLACLLKDMGRDVVLLNFPDRINGHMAVGVADDGEMKGTYFQYNGVKYYYVETTGKNWGIGSVPEIARGRAANIITF